MQRGSVSRLFALSLLLLASSCSLLLSLDGASGGREIELDEAGVGVEASIEGQPGADAGSDASLLAPSGCPQEALDPDLVLWLPFDEGTGTVARDCSGRDHLGQIGAPPDGGSWVVGKRGMALRLNDATGCVDLGLAADFRLAATPFTLGLWARYGTNDGFGQLVSKTGRYQTAGWRLSTPGAAGSAAARIHEDRPDGGTVTVETKAVPSMTWAHLALVYVPNERLELWVGGELKSSKPLSAPLLDDESAPLKIGCHDDGLYTFEGEIDDVRLIKRALTAAEIAALAK